MASLVSSGTPQMCVCVWGGHFPAFNATVGWNPVFTEPCKYPGTDVGRGEFWPLNISSPAECSGTCARRDGPTWPDFIPPMRSGERAPCTVPPGNGGGGRSMIPGGNLGLWPLQGPPTTSERLLH